MKVDTIEVYEFILPLPPKSTNSGYKTGRGNFYKDESIKEWESDCLWTLRGVFKKPIEKEMITVNIGFYFGNKRRNDIDGKIKYVLDLLQRAGAYTDDSLVTDLIVAKRFDKENPRLEVEIY